jgi:riboflavin kinase/FMN adenylyltransferase
MIVGHNVPLINSPDDRAGLIRRIFGINDIIFLHFDEEMMHMSWTDFIERLAVDFNAVHLIAGHDFRFGYKGEGDSRKLLKKCAELSIGCDIIPAVTYKGIKISSTYIRELIANGDIELAHEFLGHPHTLTETVRYGSRYGRTLGAPTINMRFADGVLVPPFGVYAAKVYLDDGTIYTAVTNIGVRPTIDSSNCVTVESYILGFDGNLYGKQVRVEFYKLLREEMRFASIDELKARIQEDVKLAQAYFTDI